MRIKQKQEYRRLPKPQYENRGFGKQAMQEMEALFPTIKEWNLDTIKQEPKLGKFYTNLGYVKLSKETYINDTIQLSFYRKMI